CGACGARHEALQKLSDDPLVECPACGASALTRLISAPSFRLKGGGWYETDFKSGNKRNLAEAGDAKSADKPTDKPAEKKPDAGKKTDAAPAKPAQTKTPETKPAAKGGD
ncbi:MAG: FmdB family zinc ribbon protein, partial [Gammaproteobacteria bacterium]